MFALPARPASSRLMAAFAFVLRQLSPRPHGIAQGLASLAASLAILPLLCSPNASGVRAILRELLPPWRPQLNCLSRRHTSPPGHRKNAPLCRVYLPHPSVLARSRNARARARARTSSDRPPPAPRGSGRRRELRRGFWQFPLLGRTLAGLPPSRSLLRSAERGAVAAAPRGDGAVRERPTGTEEGDPSTRAGAGKPHASSASSSPPERHEGRQAGKEQRGRL